MTEPAVDAPVSQPAASAALPSSADAAVASASPGSVRKRPKPGERRVQILQALAGMLEQPGSDRITTAALAARLELSEAALYRHFASKAQMFEGLIEFIEQSLFTLANQIIEREADPARQFSRLMAMVLQFGEKNPGMARVMAGDALVFENERLSVRMNQCFERIESLLRQPCKALAEQRGSDQPTVAAQAHASAATSVLQGRLHRYVRTGFKRKPTEHLDATLQLLVG